MGSAPSLLKSFTCHTVLPYTFHDLDLVFPLVPLARLHSKNYFMSKRSSSSVSPLSLQHAEIHNPGNNLFGILHRKMLTQYEQIYV